MQIARLLATIWVFFALTQFTSAVEPDREGQENFLIRAVYADGRLWVLSDAGVLSSIAEGETAWRDEPLDDRVLDLCSVADDLTIVTAKRQSQSDWAIMNRTGATWSPQITIAPKEDGFLGLACSPEDTTLLTDRRLIDLAGSELRVLDLFGEMGRGFVTSIYGTPSRVLVGFDAGEWGGGLYAIDRRTGAVANIQRNNSGQLCGGPINTKCDPITGITEIPWKPNCAAVSIGLLHLRSHGRIVEICGDQVERLYFKPEDEQQGIWSDGEPLDTVAFLHLIRRENSLWAASIDGLYEFTQNDELRYTPLPDFTEIDGIQVSFDLPGVVVVLTDINWQEPMDDGEPMLVRR